MTVTRRGPVAMPTPVPTRDEFDYQGVNYRNPQHSTALYPCSKCGRKARYGTAYPGREPHHGIGAYWCEAHYDAEAAHTRATAHPSELAMMDPAPVVIAVYNPET